MRSRASALAGTGVITHESSGAPRVSPRGADLRGRAPLARVAAAVGLDSKDLALLLPARGEARVTLPSPTGGEAGFRDQKRDADLRFDCLLSAELAHVYKPAPEVYQTAARLLGVEPAALMLVAAHPLDLRGARAAGLQTAFVDRPLEYGLGSQRATIPRRTSPWETYTSWQSG